MVPDPFEESHRQPRAETNTGQGSRRRPWYRTAAVPAVQAVQAVLRQRSGHFRFDLARTTVHANCAEDRWCRVMCATFLVVFGHCACAMPGSTADTRSARLGGFIEVILRDSGSAGIYAPRAVFQTFFGMSACRVRGDVCTVDASADHEFHLKSGQHFDDTYSLPT